MSSFHTEHKTDFSYLDLAANGNGDEKALFTIQALERLRQGGMTEADVVEIGPGGGAAFKAVTNTMSGQRAEGIPNIVNYSFVELDGISSEMLEQACKEHAPYGATKMIKGDARNLASLMPEGANVVAASAVLHEVYSYAGGYDGVDQTLRSVTDTIRPSGYFSYRDVFSVENESQHERAMHIYDKSWVYFSKLFLPYYLENATHPYHREDDKVVFEQDSKFVGINSIDADKNLSISAPVGVLRELQRHYITLRDYCWRKGSLGVLPILEGDLANDWVDQRKGLKRVYYQQVPNAAQDDLLTVMSEKAGEDIWSVDGDYFDAATDAKLCGFLKAVIEEDPAARETWNEWLAREGAETYVYMTMGNLLGATALRSLEASEGKKILLPESPSDVMIRPRGYYNRFLRRQVSSPLPDAKQMVLFKAYQPKTDRDEIADSLAILTEHCSKDTIAKIYGPIQKAS